VAAGGNINPNGVSMFEPIGGTAPMWTGKNAINPLAAIGAAQMMMEHLGETRAAALIEKGITHAVSKMKSMTANEMGMGTDAVGDLVAEYVGQAPVN
jgi:3-isopropylmalate dehydrogenase